MLEMSHPASRTKPLTLADVDPDNDADMERLEHEEVASAAERVKQAIERHRAAGLVDEKGRRISKELPPDMRPGSKTGV